MVILLSKILCTIFTKLYQKYLYENIFTLPNQETMHQEWFKPQINLNTDFSLSHTYTHTHTHTHITFSLYLPLSYTGYLLLLSYEGAFILYPRVMLFNINEVSSDQRICERTAALSDRNQPNGRKLSFCLPI